MNNTTRPRGRPTDPRTPAALNTIVAFIAQAETPPSVSQVAELIGATRTTAFHYLKVLVKQGRIKRADGYGYVTNALSPLAAFTEAIQPIKKFISREIQEQFEEQMKDPEFQKSYQKYKDALKKLHEKQDPNALPDWSQRECRHEHMYENWCYDCEMVITSRRSTQTTPPTETPEQAQTVQPPGEPSFSPDDPKQSVKRAGHSRPSRGGSKPAQ